ncbi:hypothetical protein, partial [Mesorhizobium sp.]|uniref:hypothetical protein n=1 Tax=Mesorhizobium sp. TaxID=1871066 RepID=UPI0012091E48
MSASFLIPADLIVGLDGESNRAAKVDGTRVLVARHPAHYEDRQRRRAPENPGGQSRSLAMKDFDGKVALVTGTTGIGLASA